MVHGRIRDLTDDDTFTLTDTPLFEFLSQSAIQRRPIVSEPAPSVSTHISSPTSTRSVTLTPRSESIPLTEQSPRAVPFGSLLRATEGQLAHYRDQFYVECPDIRLLFVNRPGAYAILHRVGATKDYVASHPHILDSDRIPVASVHPKTFYQYLLGGNERDASTITNHFSDYERAHALKRTSETIRRVLNGEHVPNVMKPWEPAAPGQTLKPVTLTDFRLLLKWVENKGGDPNKGSGTM